MPVAAKTLATATVKLEERLAVKLVPNVSDSVVALSHVQLYPTPKRARVPGVKTPSQDAASPPVATITAALSGPLSVASTPMNPARHAALTNRGAATLAQAAKDAPSTSDSFCWQSGGMYSVEHLSHASPDHQPPRADVLLQMHAPVAPQTPWPEHVSAAEQRTHDGP
jgi:hypothetical protein